MVNRLLLALVLAGCGSSIGTRTVARDRFDYGAAISKSWQDQMLLNLVKIRYADSPVFLEVSSVISQYTLEGTVNLASPTWGTDSSNLSPIVGASGRYSDRPTITYTPLVGEKFARSLMTPIRPDAIFFLLQAGWPANFVFRVTVKTINGLRNRSGTVLMGREADPDFYRLAQLFSEIQKSEAVGMRVTKANEKTKTGGAVAFFRKDPPADLLEKIREIRALLGFKEEGNEFKIVYGSLPETGREFAVLTRNLLEIMAEIASQMDVPEADLDRIPPMVPPPEGERWLRVKNSKERPDEGFVSVRYRDHWFFIDDRDWKSKRMFTFMMFLFSLTETERQGRDPVVTIMAGGE